MGATLNDSVENKVVEHYVLNAQKFIDAPLAIVKLGARVPFGFHGNFMSVAS